MPASASDGFCGAATSAASNDEVLGKSESSQAHSTLEVWLVPYLGHPLAEISSHISHPRALMSPFGAGVVSDARWLVAENGRRSKNQ